MKALSRDIWRKARGIAPPRGQVLSLRPGIHGINSVTRPSLPIVIDVNVV